MKPLRIDVILFWLGIIALVSCLLPKTPKPTWNGQAYSCPVPYSVYADEHEARHGMEYVHCVR